MPGPKTLDELLDAVPGLRKIRSLNADWLRRLLDRQKGECTWCGTQVPKGRRTWCSDDCVTAFRLRCDSAAQASYVQKRDADICAACGQNIAEMEREFVRKFREWRKSLENPWPRDWDAEDQFSEEHGVGRGNWREVDHIIPVIDGGGLAGPDNLRLLCGVCHRSETAKLRKRMARAKQKGS